MEKPDTVSRAESCGWYTMPSQRPESQAIQNNTTTQLRSNQTRLTSVGSSATTPVAAGLTVPAALVGRAAGAAGSAAVAGAGTGTPVRFAFLLNIGTNVSNETVVNGRKHQTNRYHRKAGTCYEQ